MQQFAVTSQEQNVQGWKAGLYFLHDEVRKMVICPYINFRTKSSILNFLVRISY